MYRFDECIKDLRYKAGITQKELATELGVSQQTVSLWESNSVYPDANSIIAVCEYFGVSSDYLLGLEPIKKRHYTKKVKSDCEFGGPRFKTSELSQVRMILDFLNDYEKKKK